MAWVAYYSLLLLLFVLASTYSAVHPDGASHFAKALTGIVPVLSGLAQAVTKVNFKLYLLTQRIWLFFHKDFTTYLRFGVRIDGLLGERPLDDLLGMFSVELSPWSPKLVSSNAHEVRFIVDRTIHLRATYEDAQISGDGEDHILIRSEELEVTFGSAKRKIDTSIVPMISKITQTLKARSSGSMLEVAYSKRNPFFSFFVAHLRPEQVSQFNLIFKPAQLSRNQQDRVVVTQQSVTINAETPEGFATLAKAFLLLTEDAATLQSI